MRRAIAAIAILIIFAGFAVGCSDRGGGGDDNAFGQGFRSGLALVERERECLDRVRDFVLDAITEGNFWSLARAFIEGTGCAKHLVEQAVEQLAPRLLSSRDDG